MDKILWESQQKINEVTRMQITLLITQIDNLIGILEDHEKDMVKMAEEINRLNKELSELKGLS